MIRDVEFQKAVVRAVFPVGDRLRRSIASAALDADQRTVAFTLDMRRYRPSGGSLLARVEVSSPYFWSRLQDEGSDGATPQRAKWLVWFENPLINDPRLQGDYFRTYEEARRAKLDLTQSEFYELIKAGVLFVRRRRGRISPKRFVEAGERPIPALLSRAMRRESSGLIRDVTARYGGSFKMPFRL